MDMGTTAGGLVSFLSALLAWNQETLADPMDEYIKKKKQRAEERHADVLVRAAVADPVDTSGGREGGTEEAGLFGAERSRFESMQKELRDNVLLRIEKEKRYREAIERLNTTRDEYR